jgi:hypothetical protein
MCPNMALLRAELIDIVQVTSSHCSEEIVNSAPS